MKNVFRHIKGDKTIWAVVSLLALFSFLPVYSSSSNLAYLYGDGNTFKFLLKHLTHLILGFVILYGVHKVPYNYFKGLSVIALPIVIILLIITITQGVTIDGANASRWIRIPIVGVTFQSSTLASVVLLTYIARYLSKIKDIEQGTKLNSEIINELNINEIFKILYVGPAINIKTIIIKNNFIFTSASNFIPL